MDLNKLNVKKMVRGTMGLMAVLSMQFACAGVIVPMYLADPTGHGKSIGTIEVEDGICGILLKPNLHDLPPGVHGFHIHEKASCADNAMAAGGHLDPDRTGQHDGPYNEHGHLGDLPVLIVNQDGTATLPTVAPRFKLSTVTGHALVIHAGGDNYADIPAKLGGGGTRIACGVIG